MPVLKCPNGKFRIGKGPCIYKNEETANRAYKGYLGSKYGKFKKENAVEKLLKIIRGSDDK